MRKVYIQFKEKGKKYVFFDNNLNVNIGDKVIVETERGQQLGEVKVISDEQKPNEEHSLIIKIANEKEIKQNIKNIKEATIALENATKLGSDLGLDMKFIDAYYTFDRKQLIFQFIADNRIDFRELAKTLAAIYKVRIELRQVGVRDKAKNVSGIGQCGRKICCSNFLKDLDSVGIAQVKNQNLSLNPSKINGQCGRLLCCLKYEDEDYKLYRQGLPEIGDIINEKKLKGTVISLDILNRKYIVLTEDNNKVEVYKKMDTDVNER